MDKYATKKIKKYINRFLDRYLKYILSTFKLPKVQAVDPLLALHLQ